MNVMKNISLVCCFLAVCMFGCTQEQCNISCELDAVAGISAIAYSYEEEAVYHQETQSWICPVKDPYALSNFKMAYDNLLTGKSAIAISSEEAIKLSELKIEATHYYLKIYPKNEEELSELESMSDIHLSYIPFDYVQLPQSITENWNAGEQGKRYGETPRYDVVYNDVMSTQGYVGVVTYSMPIIYAIWPCTVALPTSLDYELVYEVYWPDVHSVVTRNADTGEDDIMAVLEKEALRLAGAADVVATRANVDWESATARGYCYHFDNFLNKKVPVAGLKIRFQLGTKVWDTYTEEDGMYWIGKLIPANATLSMIFENTGWKITYQGQLSPIVTTWGTHAALYQHEFCPLSSHPEFETHRAVYFYKKASHSLSRGNSIRIEVSSQENSSINGSFNYLSKNNQYILIYYNNQTRHNLLLGTVFHELGHNSMYTSKGRSDFMDTDDIIIESWARFTGWYMPNLYYASLGYKLPEQTTPGASVGVDAQSWHGLSNGGKYAPLFIDLMDDFNQRDYYRKNKLGYYTYCHGYPDDDVKNVPANIIQSLAFNSQNMQDFITEANKYIGVYYMRSVFDRYFYNAYSVYWWNI